MPARAAPYVGDLRDVTPVSSSPSGLPVPAPEALAHSERVVAQVREAIRGHEAQWLPFDAYMELVLYAPALGYYSAGARKFGEDGDFITAPEVSPLFGHTLARWVRTVANRLGDAQPWVVVEYGGGSGALAEALLHSLSDGSAAPPAQYLLVEPSGELRARQQERLARYPFADRVTWLDGPPTRPMRGVVIANEVLDALPCTRFRLGADGVEELGVAIGPDDALVLAWRAAPPPLVHRVRALEQARGGPFPAGYASELCPRREAWLASISPGLGEGAMLLIDYGLGAAEYYDDARRDGTFLCYYRHRAHDDPLHLPGLQDLTAWVDFSAVGACARAQGLRLDGFTTQAGFLLGNGIDALVTDGMAAARREADRLTLASAARQLLLPGAMGERFRVMGLSRGLGDAPLAGFDRPDLRRTLGDSKTC